MATTNGAIYPANGTVMPPTGKFKPMVGLPEIIALTAVTGEMVSSNFGGSEVKLMLTNGQPWYVAMAMADVIRTSGIMPRQQLEVTKTGKGPMDWKIVPLQAHLGTPAAPSHAAGATAMVAQPSSAQVTQNTPDNPAASRFLGVYRTAIDVLIDAKAYAQTQGLAIEIRCEDVRALAATIMIDNQKGGR